ncbi:MAG: PQQ-binding-like beta-propeller repeat protein [Chloroflexia bacterium]
MKWKFKTTDHGSNTTPAVNGNVVYFGQYGTLYAVDADTGTETWNYEIDNQATSSPAIAGDTVYVGGWDELYAIRTDLGVRRWVFRSEAGADETYWLDPVVDGGTVYFGGRQYFHAVDGETGRQKWRLELTNVARSVPTINNGTVYFGTYSADGRGDTYVYALDSQTGREKWKLKTAGGGVWGAVAVTEGVVYAGTWNQGLVALDARNGQVIWHYNPGRGVITSPAVAYGTVYITDKGTLYAIDAQTGKERWQIQAGGFSSDPVIADGIVYFTTTVTSLTVLIGGKPSGYLHAVDAQTGQELWTFSVEGETMEAPAIANGTVYFGSGEGYLYAVK